MFRVGSSEARLVSDMFGLCWAIGGYVGPRLGYLGLGRLGQVCSGLLLGR